MLDRIIKEKWFTARATIGFWPANAEGDDIAVYADDTRSKKIATFHTLRQQLEKREGRFNAALSDFIAPATSGVPDYVGGFVVTAGIGEDAVADRFKNANDDYSSILCKALADRLAEAFAERMHQRVRKEFWGYAPDEALASDQLILEQYAGIRPAPGYPAQPDHTEKATLFRLLDAEKTAGVKLTESFAMWPGSSVSGLYFSHPESFYFGVGKIERDQVEDYAARKGMSVTETERWLAPVLNYIPSQEAGAAKAPAGRDRPRQRRRLASARLHLRGASGLAEEGVGRSRCLLPFSPCGRRCAKRRMRVFHRRETPHPSSLREATLSHKGEGKRMRGRPMKILLLLAIAGEFSRPHRAQSEKRPADVVFVDLDANAHREPEYRKLNPQMALPALVEDDGTTLFQSLAILEYLDEKYPSPPLLPADIGGRARVRALALMVACEGHPLLTPRVRRYLDHELNLRDTQQAAWRRHWTWKRWPRWSGHRA
jgi:glutathione S-transferase